MTIVSRFALVLALGLGAQFAIPESPSTAATKDSTCKRKKRRKKRRRKKSKKVTAKTIKRWQKAGLSEEEIVERAEAKGYRVTRREKRKLRKYRVRPAIIAALTGKPLSPPVVRREPIDLDAEIDPNSIDFDSVPPPKGIPQEYVRKDTEPKKKVLNTSLRPSAPFKPSEDNRKVERKPLRKVIVATSE